MPHVPCVTLHSAAKTHPAYGKTAKQNTTPPHSILLWAPPFSLGLLGPSCLGTYQRQCSKWGPRETCEGRVLDTSAAKT
eukprot:10676708-Alexandrium_andersonii.AAC.1